ncbi:MAG TPA: SDR family NAD(P)-dependent oxidoreductase [Gemmatimonadaceae bacterium]|nr:SDR family NAD(P)-dependent oxidoreductase [Gemmatimonadaceae bacterium]
MAESSTAPRKLAIVTGTTSGIGQALARLLLERGWRVLGAARRPSAIEHDAYEHARVDLHDINALEAALATRLTTLLADPALAQIGLVNNAADPALLGPIATLDARRLATVFATNVAAPIWLMGALVRLTPAEIPLRIVNVSSGAAVRAFPGLAAYGSSKAALRMAGMALAAELDSTPDTTLRSRDIAVLSYEPGTVDTPMQGWARSQSPDVLPSRDLFVRFEAEGLLVSPDAPSRDIVAFLESQSAPRFNERRLTG